MTKYVECRVIDIDEPSRPQCTSIIPKTEFATISRRPKPQPRRVMTIDKYQSPAEQMYWQGLLLNCLA